MKRNFIKIPVLALGLILSVTALNSCVQDGELSITEPSRYMDSDVKSYGDLFKVFWKVMDQRYNYFYEQKRKDGLDWNAIYREYYPKFFALKSFGRNTDNDKDIKDDRLKAIQYFTEIVDPIIDRHFNVRISMPTSNNSLSTSIFFGDMKSKASNRYSFILKSNYMQNRLVDGSIFLPNNFLAGYLKSNPDIYYCSFHQFSLATSFKLDFSDKYLTPNKENLLTVADIDASKELNAIKDPVLRNKIRDFTIDILNQWNSFPASAEVKAFNDQIANFNSTEVVSDAFLSVTEEAYTKSKNLIGYQDLSYYSSVFTYESFPYIQWFINRMNDHVVLGYKLPEFQIAAERILYNVPIYKDFFNPLHEGKIKKLIIDLRDNGGGLAVDARFFTDRFITKNAVWGYQRVKEGNGQFNYTPWVPIQAKPHKFGLPKNIPIVILTDKGSASMSEISTLMLKSQGSHVVSIGDYSAGATAGLGNSDDFNGGLVGVVGDHFNFYMPLLATKNANGKVIEGVGIEPNIYVTPPTDAEVVAMQTSPKTFVDRVMNEAVKYLSTK